MEFKITSTSFNYSGDNEEIISVSVTFNSPYIDGQSLNGTVVISPEEFNVDINKLKPVVKNKLIQELS